MIDAFTILTAWPAVLVMLVGFVKKFAKSIGRRNDELFVRTLPYHAELFGILSAPIVLELVDPLVDFVELGGLSVVTQIGVCAFAGIGAGGVASKGWKGWRQGLAGDDRRIEDRRNL